MPFMKISVLCFSIVSSERVMTLFPRLRPVYKITENHRHKDVCISFFTAGAYHIFLCQLLKVND